MLEVRVTKFGPPEVLQVFEQPDPDPGPGEVCIAVRAIGINFADIMARMGLYPDSGKPPFVTGYECSGVIEKVGTGVEQFKEGDQVIGMKNFGCYANRVVTSASMVFPIPANMDQVKAGAFPVTYLTAWHSLVYVGNLHRGERILIKNAGGAMGTASVQIALLRGAEIFGAASPGKHEFLKELGVHHTIDYRADNWEEVVKEMTGGEGVEMIFDPVGGRSLKKAFELLAHTGRLICYGVSSAAQGKARRLVPALWEIMGTPKFSPIKMMNKNRGVFGVHIGHLWHRYEILQEEMQILIDLLEQGKLDPVIDSTFPLEKAAEAHNYIQERKNFGKVVLTVEL